MQAACDSDLRFTAVSCKHVGSTNDGVAFATSDMKAANESLPLPYHWNADPAYNESVTMIVPFPGVNIHITFPSKESFNFYHSQVRITIERCFGVFIARWGILWCDLKHDVGFIMKIVHACCRLHNFCINQSVPVINTGSAARPMPPRAAVDDNGRLVDDQWRDAQPNEVFNYTSTQNHRSGNALRDIILKKIVDNGYIAIRSHHNVE